MTSAFTQQVRTLRDANNDAAAILAAVNAVTVTYRAVALGDITGLLRGIQGHDDGRSLLSVLEDNATTSVPAREAIGLLTDPKIDNLHMERADYRQRVEATLAGLLQLGVQQAALDALSALWIVKSSPALDTLGRDATADDVTDALAQAAGEDSALALRQRLGRASTAGAQVVADYEAAVAAGTAGDAPAWSAIVDAMEATA